MAPKTPQDEKAPALKEVLASLQPAVLAVERADARLEAALVEQRTAMKAASEARTKAISGADRARQKVEAAYQAAVTRATTEYQGVADAAKAKVEAARQAQADACDAAEPLLKALDATKDRVATIAQRRGR